MTFDGPGQQAALYEQGIPFRPDWEAVLTPVLDTMLGRLDIDANRIAVIGVSQAGYGIPRALAFEHRFAAAVADPGVINVGPHGRIRHRRRCANNQKVANERCLTANAPRLRQRRRCASAENPTDSTEVLGPRSTRRSRRIASGRGAQITTPLLITDPEEKQFWPGQSQQLYDRPQATHQVHRPGGLQPPLRAARVRAERNPYLRLARAVPR